MLELIARGFDPYKTDFDLYKTYLPVTETQLLNQRTVLEKLLIVGTDLGKLVEALLRADKALIFARDTSATAQQIAHEIIARILSETVKGQPEKPKKSLKRIHFLIWGNQTQTESRLSIQLPELEVSTDQLAAKLYQNIEQALSKATASQLSALKEKYRKHLGIVGLPLGAQRSLLEFSRLEQSSISVSDLRNVLIIALTEFEKSGHYVEATAPSIRTSFNELLRALRDLEGETDKYLKIDASPDTTVNLELRDKVVSQYGILVDFIVLFRKMAEALQRVVESRFVSIEELNGLLMTIDQGQLGLELRGNRVIRATTTGLELSRNLRRTQQALNQLPRDTYTPKLIEDFLSDELEYVPTAVGPISSDSRLDLRAKVKQLFLEQFDQSAIEVGDQSQLIGQRQS